MLSDRVVYLLVKNYVEVEKLVNRLKKIDYQLARVTLNKHQRMLLLQEKYNIMQKLKRLF